MYTLFPSPKYCCCSHFKSTKGIWIICPLDSASVKQNGNQWMWCAEVSRDSTELQFETEAMRFLIWGRNGIGYTCLALLHRSMSTQQQQLYRLKKQHCTVYTKFGIICLLFFFWPDRWAQLLHLKLPENKHKEKLGLAHVKTTAIFSPLFKRNFAKRWAGIINHTLFFA